VGAVSRRSRTMEHIETTAPEPRRGGHLIVIVDGINGDGWVAEAAVDYAMASGSSLTVALLLTPTWLTALIPLAGVVPYSTTDLEADALMSLAVRLNQYPVDWEFFPILARPIDALTHLMRQRPARVVFARDGWSSRHRRTARIAFGLRRRFGVSVRLCGSRSTFGRVAP
jgi:hypothetical protein